MAFRGSVPVKPAYNYGLHVSVAARQIFRNKLHTEKAQYLLRIGFV
jgi:hypothetical protein